MAASVAQHFTRQMGLTLEEFLRSLPAAVEPLEYRIQGRHILITHPQGHIEIQLHPTGERRIASLVIPITPVEFSFTGLNEAQRCHFMSRFDRYFHRGGG